MKILIREAINLEDLEIMTAGLEAAAPGSKVEINNCFELVVSDKRHARAIFALFPGKFEVEDRSTTKEIEDTSGAVVGHSRTRVSSKKEPSIPKNGNSKSSGSRSYTIEASGEKISTVELHRQIQAGGIASGTILISSAGQRVIVDGWALKVIPDIKA
jgi:hypothetical protein